MQLHGTKRNHNRRKGIFALLLCLFLTANLAAQPSGSQGKNITFRCENEKLHKALMEIERQSGYYRVQYVMEDVSPYTVSVNLKNANMDSAIKVLLRNTPLEYEFNDRFVQVYLPKTVAQQSEKKIISGRVVDASGYPLPGVAVQLEGTTRGVVTDLDGIFSMPDEGLNEATLLVSFVGMKDKSIRWKGRSLDITMEEDLQGIEEVVVTGYANISQKSFTGNARTMTATELKKISPNNVLKSIQVLDPSFRLEVNNEMGSNPNAMPGISVRGASGIGLTELDVESLSATALQNDPSLPTFILDGFEVNVSKLYDMDMNRIESITLLKDAAATAIYGSRAANGVVVITTIAPKEGEIRLSYNYNLTLQTPDLSDYNLMNAREKLEAEKAAGLFDKNPTHHAYYHEKLRLLEQGVETDWLSKPLRNAASHRHFLRLEGGSKGLRYGIDVNYQGNNGVMKGSERNRYGINFELQYNVGKLIFKNIAGYVGVNSQESPYGEFSKYTTMNPYYPYLDKNGVMLKRIEEPDGTLIANPLYDASLGSYNKTKSKEFTNNFSVQYYLTDKFYLKGNVALTYLSSASDVYTSPEAGMFELLSYKGDITMDNISSTSIDGGLFGYYNDMIGNHNINLVGGFNLKEDTEESRRVYVRDLPNGGFSNPQFAREFPNAPSVFKQTSRLFSAMTSLNYTYNNIYLADATFRLDGNSSFGTESRFAPFWSGGLGLNLHNYEFMKKYDWFTELKIRGSYGVTGKADFPARTARTVYQIESQFVYPTGTGGNIAAMGNKNLKWERTKITDVGATVNLFNGMFVFTGSYYYRRTVDLIADMYIPSSSGFRSYKDNIGEITNKGYELSLRVRAINKPNTQLYFAANAAANKNRIQKISDSLKSYNEKIEEMHQNQADRLGAKTPLVKYVEGASTSSIYAMQSLGIDPQTGKELFRYKDGSIGTEWIAAENVVCGNTDPKVNGTFSSNLYLSGLTLDLYFTYNWGGEQYNQTLQTKIENANLKNNVDKRVFTDRWVQQGDIVGFKSLKDYNIPTNPTSRFVQKDNTLTLQSLSLGYEIPKEVIRKLHLTRLKLAFNMNDVFRVSTIKQERGILYPYARSYDFSINVNF